MEFLKDPISIMMITSIFKNNNNNNNDNINNNMNYILIFLITIFCKIIQNYDFTKNIYNYINSKNNDISITITSHEVPVVRNFSNISISKLIYSKKFLSIVHYICNSKNINLKSYTEIISYNSELSNTYCDKISTEFILMPLSKSKFNIYKDIYCDVQKIENEINNQNEKDKSQKICNKNHFIINLYIDKSNGMNILLNFIDLCINDYEKYILSKKDSTKLNIFEYKNSEKVESIIELKFNQYSLEHNKDLNTNIFFENKEKLINYIKPFIYDPLETINLGEEKYKRSGFTFKAGLLFYGSPGCGKTSTIKAILKYTNRNGIIINLSKVKTCEDLESIFRKRTINGMKFEGKQLCYILEDSDAFDNNIIHARKENIDNKFNNNDFNNNDFNNNESNEINDLSKLIESTAMNFKDFIKDEDKINLSCFLNILDGIIELHGVMIIMTTNHPEKIDKALIRPGRFDFKYEFKKASIKIIKNMLKFKYELTDIQIDNYFQNVDIEDEFFSPAEIQSICFKNELIEDCINELVFLNQIN
jgi:hypothetical protein